MQKCFVLVVCLMLLAFSASACRNDPAGDSCPDVAGVFVASYQYLDGSCGNFEGNLLKVAAEDHGTVTKVENRLSDTLTTQVILKGCTLGVKQSVDSMGAKISEIAGDLHVQDDTELLGMVSRTEYQADGAISCHALYDATYRRQDVVIDGAVQRAIASP